MNESVHTSIINLQNPVVINVIALHHQQILDEWQHFEIFLSIHHSLAKIA